MSSMALLSPESENSLLFWTGLPTAIIITSVNIPLLWIVKEKTKTTLVNLLIGVDCLFALLNIPMVLTTARIIVDAPCWFSNYAFFVSLMNRLIPVGIVIYRFVYTCRVSWVETVQQRKVLHFLISGGMFGLTVALTLFSLIYREKSYLYLKCLGKEDDFFSQYEENGLGLRLFWLLPLYHPFHLISILLFFGYIVVVPVGYFYIYRFRKRHDSETRGLSENSHQLRKNKNLVTTQFNLLIWLCEVVSGVVLIFPGSNLFIILYFKC